MARVTIRLQYNLETGKKDILVELASDPDALPVEHEREHRDIVQQLLGRGVLAPDEVGQLRVQREAPRQAGQRRGEVEASLEDSGSAATESVEG
jgi:hypothetical protein